MDFENGAIDTIITRFDVWDSQLPRIEIYGSEGSLVFPDPNTSGGLVYLKEKGDKEWKGITVTCDYSKTAVASVYLIW